MEVLETIPIYTAPSWPMITFFIGLGIAILCIALLGNTEYAEVIMGIIATIVILVGIISFMILRKTEFSHNEYIVHITDMPAQEFIEKYEVTKRFDYSDVIQIKEIENK